MPLAAAASFRSTRRKADSRQYRASRRRCKAYRRSVTMSSKSSARSGKCASTRRAPTGVSAMLGPSAFLIRISSMLGGRSMPNASTEIVISAPMNRCCRACPRRARSGGSQRRVLPLSRRRAVGQLLALRQCFPVAGAGERIGCDAVAEGYRLEHVRAADLAEDEPSVEGVARTDDVGY